jgi:hypothetical protein
MSPVANPFGHSRIPRSLSSPRTAGSPVGQQGFRSARRRAGYSEAASMGTAAMERSAERTGDGASPAVCAVDQITPERPEERPPSAGLAPGLRQVAG